MRKQIITTFRRQSVTIKEINELLKQANLSPLRDSDIVEQEYDRGGGSSSNDDFGSWKIAVSRELSGVELEKEERRQMYLKLKMEFEV